MRRLVVWTLSVLLLAPPLWAQDDTKDKEKPKPPPKRTLQRPKAPPQTEAQKQLAALKMEVQKAQQPDLAAYRQAKTETEQKKILARYNQRPVPLAGKFLKLAEKNAKDPAAFEALMYIVTSAGAAPEADKAVEILMKDHLAQVAGPMGGSLARSDSKAAEKLLRAVAEKSPDPKHQAQGYFNLALHLKNRSESAHEEKLPEADQLGAEAEKTFALVLEKFSDNTVLAKQAETELFELRNLAIGKLAPEIEGEDTDGKPIKLTDYRGKVVVLDFWGHW